MPYHILQGGSTLQRMDTSGTIDSLTLPTGVKLDSTKRPRFAIFNRYVILVNSPTRPLSIDPEGVVRVLCPRPPRTRLDLSGVTAGTLSGTFLVKQSFLVLDVDGNIIAESELGPSTTAVTISSKFLRVAAADISSDTVSASRFYRTTTNGTTYFPWTDIDGNTQVTFEDDLSDVGLQLVAAPTLGTPPNNLTLIAQYKARLWGVSATEIDTLRLTDANKMYSWPLAFGLIVGRPGSDARGITGIVPRREFLMVGRQDACFQIVGTTLTDFRPVVIKENIGIEAPDSVQVYRDVAYWLAKDGVYSWGDEGIRCLSDNKVRSWFTTDTYFNRARFQYAVGRIDQTRNKYQLLLTNTGDSVENRWIELDLGDSTWWGPHKTDAFTPTWGSSFIDSNNLTIPVFGSSNGFIWKDQATRTDDTATGIALDVDTKYHDMNSPDIEKQMLELSVINKKQSAGTLTITPSIVNDNQGVEDAVAQSAISMSMTTGRNRLRRIGRARLMKLNLAHSTAAQDVEIYGYELPYFELGRR